MLQKRDRNDVHLGTTSDHEIIALCEEAGYIIEYLRDAIGSYSGPRAELERDDAGTAIDKIYAIVIEVWQHSRTAIETGQNSCVGAFRRGKASNTL
jgi:hypothetical protein